MKGFGKIFVLVFHNYFLKIKLTCDKENMLISNTCSFQKKMLSNLTCYVNKSMAEFTVKEITVFRVALDCQM